MTTRAEDSDRESSLRGTKASSSSKNITHGEEARARENTWRTARSLSPTYYVSPGSESILKKEFKTTHFVEQLRSFHTDEVCSGLIGNCLGQKRLPTARWTPK